MKIGQSRSLVREADGRIGFARIESGVSWQSEDGRNHQWKLALQQLAEFSTRLRIQGFAGAFSTSAAAFSSCTEAFDALSIAGMTNWRYTLSSSGFSSTIFIVL